MRHEGIDLSGADIAIRPEKFDDIASNDVRLLHPAHRLFRGEFYLVRGAMQPDILDRTHLATIAGDSRLYLPSLLVYGHSRRQFGLGFNGVG